MSSTPPTGPGFWSRIWEHVLGNMLVLAIALIVSYFAIAFFTGSFPSPQVLVSGLENKPYVVWYARTGDESATKTNFLFFGTDRVTTRYSIMVENLGQCSSSATKVVVESRCKIASVRSFGACEIRASNGNWIGVPFEDQPLDPARNRIELWVRFLAPNESVQIDLVMERKMADTWTVPTTQVTFERGSAAMGIASVDDRWR